MILPPETSATEHFDSVEANFHCNEDIDLTQKFPKSGWHIECLHPRKTLQDQGQQPGETLMHSDE